MLKKIEKFEKTQRPLNTIPLNTLMPLTSLWRKEIGERIQEETKILKEAFQIKGIWYRWIGLNMLV